MCSVSTNSKTKDLKKHVRVGNVGTRMAEGKQALGSLEGSF